MKKWPIQVNRTKILCTRCNICRRAIFHGVKNFSFQRPFAVNIGPIVALNPAATHSFYLGYW